MRLGVPTYMFDVTVRLCFATTSWHLGILPAHIIRFDIPSIGLPSDNT